MLLEGGRDDELVSLRVENENEMGGADIFNTNHSSSEAGLKVILEEMRKNKTLALVDGI
jgi:hypothetical protein